MFGLATIGYLFLGGVGGALSFVGGIVGFNLCTRRHCVKSKTKNTLMGALFGVALLMLLTGALLLLADAGNYKALINLFFPPVPTLLSFGTWAITVDLGVLGVLFVAWQGQAELINRCFIQAMHVLGLVVGSAVVIYTGIFLASMRAVPLWHTPLVPVLFALSSLSCALVIFVVAVNTLGIQSTFATLVTLATKYDMIVIILECISALAFVAQAFLIPQAGSYAVIEQSIRTLVAGENAWLWWGAFFGMGMLMTFVFDGVLLRFGDSKPGRLWNTLAPVFCVLCGAFALRYCMVVAGMHPALSF